jgi:hypothetical protein
MRIYERTPQPKAAVRAELAEAKAQFERLKAIDTAQRAERDITQPLS